MSCLQFRRTRPQGPCLRCLVPFRSRYPDLSIQASGGVGALSDLVELAGTGVDAAIVGKALLEGAFTVAEAVEYLK